MYYNICPECGAALDPGEKCDCQRTSYDEKSTAVTMADWKRAGSFEHAAKPGDAVEDAIVEEFINCLPPRTFRESLVQCGEPYSFAKDPRDGKTKSTYGTFHRRGGVWYYCGNCFAGEYVEPAKLA